MSTFSNTQLLKAIFAVNELILSVIQENICSMHRLLPKPPETKC